MEFQPIFTGYVITASSFQESIFRKKIGFKRESGFRFIIDVFYFAFHNFRQSFGDGHAINVHTGRMCLHDSCFSIYINDQAGQIVTFTMYQTISVIGRIGSDTDTTTHVISYLQFAFPKIVIDRFLFEGEYTYGNATYLEVSFGNEFFLGGIYFHNFTLFRLTVETGDGT